MITNGQNVNLPPWSDWPSRSTPSRTRSGQKPHALHGDALCTLHHHAKQVPLFLQDGAERQRGGTAEAPSQHGRVGFTLHVGEE